MKVPFGAFMPVRAFVPGSTNPNNNIPTVDLPVNVGVIKCGTDLILYDTGWKQRDYLKMTGSDHWAPRPAIAAVGRGVARERLNSQGDKNRIVPNSRFTTSQKWNSTGIMGNEELRRRE